ncbi:hypothetical protein F5882DRAFT_396330 [Hyaloscypha sp. PMI_1271]|nr:hypothetical protein F5882DRAFT_396330 [Hyaloscypha sp. PMI_1271]
MSVHLAKSADLATSQADEITKWTSKLIAVACRERVQDKIHTLKTQADLAKRKILDTAELDSSWTIKANFRLIFGPLRDTEYKSRATKAIMATNLIRINTIRGLCESNPHGVITLSTTYPTKVWTKSSPGRKDRHRPRIDDSDRPAREIEPLPLVQTSELATQTPLSSQYTSGRNETQDRGYKQDLTTDKMKYIYINALASNISKIPELFRAAVQNSQYLFPKDNRQDVSFTIWCGNEDGVHLTDFFGG